MSTDTTATDPAEKREERLEVLYEHREQLQTIANSEADIEYAEYARTGLQKLREAGYDV